MADMGYMGLTGENLPFSAEAEQSVLGAILIDPPSILLVADTLKPYHFYVPQHKTIYEALANMFELNSVIDFVTLLEWLKKKGKYDEVGGKTYLTQLANTVPSSANISTYAGIVRDKYTVRSLITASRDIINDAEEGKTDPALMLDHAERRIFDIRQDKDISGLRHISDVLENETFVTI